MMVKYTYLLTYSNVAKYYIKGWYIMTNCLFLGWVLIRTVLTGVVGEFTLVASLHACTLRKLGSSPLQSIFCFFRIVVEDVVACICKPATWCQKFRTTWVRIHVGRKFLRLSSGQSLLI